MESKSISEITNQEQALNTAAQTAHAHEDDKIDDEDATSFHSAEEEEPKDDEKGERDEAPQIQKDEVQDDQIVKCDQKDIEEKRENPTADSTLGFIKPTNDVKQSPLDEEINLHESEVEQQAKNPQILSNDLNDQEESSTDKSEVLFAMVDCEAEPEIAAKYHVNKYPTIKLFRFGELIKKEFRGQRSVDAISDYVLKQLESTVQPFMSIDELNKHIDPTKHNVIVYFAAGASHPAYQHFYKAASSLREDCAFWIGSGDWVRPVVGAEMAMFFRGPKTDDKSQLSYKGSMDDYDHMKKWLTDLCVPFVREITFENAEELTEEGLPFLILFRVPGDTQSEQLFSNVVTGKLSDQKNAVNFLMADGKKFAHPLHHLGKSEHDLPLIAIDSFRHMYLFPDFKQLGEHGRLRQFVLDLHSGKLHREFHQGPDPTQPPQPGMNPSEMPKVGNTQPPPSVFKQLKPAETRYSLLDKTEL